MVDEVVTEDAAAAGRVSESASRPPAEALRALADAAAAIRENVAKVIVGAEEPMTLATC